MKTIRIATLVLVAWIAPLAAGGVTSSWSEEQANAWYAKQPWLVGSNYITSNAINELEMWQADTFDLATNDRELGFAEGLGMNTMRVFLHNLPYKEDPAGFLQRIDQFLQVAQKHHIKITFVLLDSVWDPYPKSGKQREPRHGVHNSGWAQAPGREILENPGRWGEIHDYVQGVVGRFKDDDRVLMWDMYNEPDNTNNNSYGAQEPADKPKLVQPLLTLVFAFAREAGATQPLTSGVWMGTWPDNSKLSPMEHEQISNSDVISFHNYSPLPEMKEAVEHLRRYKRPLICTEYMARPRGSTFAAIAPYLKQQKIAAYNWGFVAGKSNTIYPWDSWQHPYASEPKVWFHDIFRPDGTPFDPKEVALIKRLTGKN